MSNLRVDDEFSNALRAELVGQVQRTTLSASSTSPSRLWLGVGVLCAAGVLAGVAAAAAGLFLLPGAEQVTPLQVSPTAVTYSGPATMDLGTAPEGTTGIELTLTCLTPGYFQFDDGARATCTATDVGMKSAETKYTVRIAAGQHTVTISTDRDTEWQLTARYVKQESTDWGVNDKGETYGVENREKGTPDLVAVIATNGASGYVYATQLSGPQPTTPEDAARNFSSPRPSREIPVYLSDGETLVGVFQAAG